MKNLFDRRPRTISGCRQNVSENVQHLFMNFWLSITRLTVSITVCLHDSAHDDVNKVVNTFGF